MRLGGTARDQPTVPKARAQPGDGSPGSNSTPLKNAGCNSLYLGVVEQLEPPVSVIQPTQAAAKRYDELYSLYRRLYTETLDTAHALAAIQRSPRVNG